MVQKKKESQDKLDIILKKIDDLDKRLTRHIEFIEKVYAPLKGSIERFRGFFK